jgi:tetratricopeptide (TPR) repeat protein
MTTEQQEKVSRGTSKPGFVSRFVPWFIGAGVLLIYLFTLNHWVSLRSLTVVAKIAGWDWHPGNISWRPSAVEPLHFLLTYPFRWFSGGAQLIALNLFSAICGALTLALLARSVSILPQDRTREQRQRENGPASVLNVPNSWLPPFVAVLVCGLQLLFWENAVAHTGQMLNLLVFAYVIRCLLEFRISKKDSWLTKMALVYGLGVTNNWAMIGFFPFFLVAVVWIKGQTFFGFRFISRMIGFGLIGLSLYLLFPIIAAVSPNSDQTFFQTLLGHLRYQKGFLFDIPFRQMTSLRGRLAVISLTSLLPLLLIGIRWPSFRGDISAVGGMITAFMFRLVHLFFLAILISLFFDPPYSPYELGYQLMPFLTFYYLSALAVGYFAGYALLVFGRDPVQAWSRPSASIKVLNRVIFAVVIVGCIIAPAALARKNFPTVQATNSDAASQFAKSIAEALPSSGAIVLSDDSTHLYLLQAAYAKMGKPSQNILVETSSLLIPDYHQYLNRRFPKDWPTHNPTNTLSEIGLVLGMDALSKTHRVFYAHPSFGYFFERFYPTPHKLVYELKPYPGTDLLPPPLSKEVIAENQNFWNAFTKETFPPLPSLGKRSEEVKMINAFYSRSLNYWGTQLQKANRLPEANQAFATAVALNPDNAIAQINQRFNTTLQRGEIRPVQTDDSLVKALNQFGSLQGAMQWNGPFDERDFCIQLGAVFGVGNNFRQSAQYFMRALDFSPKNIQARLGLAKTYIDLRQPDEALKLTQQLREDEKTALLDDGLQFELLRTEALAYLAKNDFSTAEKMLLAAQKEKPKNENRAVLLTQLYMAAGRYTNAMQTVQQQLKVDPENTRTIFTKGVLQMQLGDFAKAIETFNRVLQLDSKNFDALLNRAISYLQSGKFDLAKKDYETLLETLPKANTYAIYFRLGDLAEKQKDKSAAIRNYKAYLKRAPLDAPDRAEAKKRIAQLQDGKS